MTLHRLAARSTPLLLAAVVVAATLGASSLARQSPPQAPPAGAAGFPDLVGGLKATKGCLGVETAQTASGKSVIFAWFADKRAVNRWYHSDMHVGVMKQFFGGEPGGEALAGVADDFGPIMMVASITMSDRPHHDATALPVSQIAIEAYTPMNGGVFLGSRFAPEGVKVKGMKDYSPPAK